MSESPPVPHPRPISRTRPAAPAGLIMTVDEAVMADRRYFDEHPDEFEYIREFVPGEFGAVELPEIPPGFRYATLVEAGLDLMPITEFIGGRNAEVEDVSWSSDAVWLNKEQTVGFRGVPDAVWNFHIGGYQVCEKWLKDRKGRTLSKVDVAHYQKIVVALAETIRLMKEIDEVIEAYGGWSGAFEAAKSIKVGSRALDKAASASSAP